LVSVIEDILESKIYLGRVLKVRISKINLGLQSNKIDKVVGIK